MELTVPPTQTHTYLRLTTPQTIIRCPLNALRHKMLLASDGPQQRLPLFFTMFERLDHTFVQHFCDTDFSQVRIVSLSCLDEMGSLAYEDNLALYAFIKRKIRHGQYHFNVANMHARLALACIKIIDRY